MEEGFDGSVVGLGHVVDADDSGLTVGEFVSEGEGEDVRVGEGVSMH